MRRPKSLRPIKPIPASTHRPTVITAKCFASSKPTTESDILPAKWTRTSPTIEIAIGNSIPAISGNLKPMSLALILASAMNNIETTTQNARIRYDRELVKER